MRRHEQFEQYAWALDGRCSLDRPSTKQTFRARLCMDEQEKLSAPEADLEEHVEQLLAKSQPHMFALHPSSCEPKIIGQVE